MVIEGVDALTDRIFPVCVVGSGPVGLAMAVDLARRGIDVLLLESGGKTANGAVQALSAAHIVDPDRHDDMGIAVSRQLGGSSNLWGGRCIPFDPIDFESRDYVPTLWPIGASDLAPYWERAVAATASGAPVYSADTPLVPPDGIFSDTALERWVNIQATQDVFADEIANNPHLHVRTLATMTQIHVDDTGRVEAIDIAHSLSGETVKVPITHLVIAAGGIESARLLLSAQRQNENLFGGSEGALGRYYMGHVIGEIADVVFRSPATAEAMDFYVDSHGSYVRRRFVPSARVQRDHRLLNSAFWPVVPPVADLRHRSSILSAVYLTLAFGPVGRLIVAEAIRRRHVRDKPQDVLAHFGNMMTGLPSAIAFAANFFRKRFGGPQRLPGFFIHNKANRYGLAYHSEQLPNRESRVWLDGGTDRLGMPKLAIDLRFLPEDAASIVRTHELLGDWLEKHELGQIEYRCPLDQREEAVLRLAAHGTHQIGLTRMGTNRMDAVVDAHLSTFDVPNLYVASCSVLPTSGQANPTLTAIALSLRLADRLASGIAA